MGMTETVLFGFLALITVIAAICWGKRSMVPGLILSISTILLVCLSAHNWRLALIDSGKNPAWFGLCEYPFASAVLYILLLAAVLNIISITKNKSTS